MQPTACSTHRVRAFGSLEWEQRKIAHFRVESYSRCSFAVSGLRPREGGDTETAQWVGTDLRILAGVSTAEGELWSVREDRSYFVRISAQLLQFVLRQRLQLDVVRSLELGGALQQLLILLGSVSLTQQTRLGFGTVDKPRSVCYHRTTVLTDPDVTHGNTAWNAVRLIESERTLWVTYFGRT